MTDITIGETCYTGNALLLSGTEIVWDFRHLQKAKFTYYGVALDFGPLIGASVQEYSGWIYGLKKGIEDYSGPFMTSSIGLEFSIPTVFDAMIGDMWADSLDRNTGKVDPNGVTAKYLWGSIGKGKGLPILISTSYTKYEMERPLLIDFSHAPSGERSGKAARFAADLENTIPFTLDAAYAKELILQWGTVDRNYANRGD